ncbi:hypothetical protein H6F76_09165 [Leptolyngbya sp. FACHB-321]|uniref:hypothetical protein n=1 Tax=Leptolyngbya sp. FACHB-321 TaxID=2692807 RepID=UPI0016842D20|nr:hypothetical protein [Leptolyngbya sp. FACHB-321]MBD2035196.1 hypothetical protein [Leptolyngbya sp. FACHB-321]
MLRLIALFIQYCHLKILGSFSKFPACHPPSYGGAIGKWVEHQAQTLKRLLLRKASNSDRQELTAALKPLLACNIVVPEIKSNGKMV